MKLLNNRVEVSAMKYIGIVLLFFVLNACNKHDIETYDVDSRFLYIPNEEGIDTLFVSFAHHLGTDEYAVPFEVWMIGERCDRDLIYKVGVVDSLTTALPEDYALPERMFMPAGQLIDTLWVTLKKSEKLKTQTLKLMLKIEDNENFKVGYANALTAKITYNDQMSKPLWWDDDMTNNFLGTYSDKKYTEFFKCTGVSDLTEMPAWEKRKLVLEFREYIEKNNITEENGDPMTVVAY